MVLRGHCCVAPWTCLSHESNQGWVNNVQLTPGCPLTVRGMGNRSSV